jgi:predicted transcriptional regulator
MSITKQAMRVISIKLPRDLEQELSRLARKSNSSRSAILRDALEQYANNRPRSVTAAAGEVVGSVRAPRDLSTHKKHLVGYGE